MTAICEPSAHSAVPRIERDLWRVLGVKAPALHLGTSYQQPAGSKAPHYNVPHCSLTVNGPAAKAFAPLWTMIKMHPRVTQSGALPTSDMATLLRRLSSEGTLQDCFMAFQKTRKAKPNPAAGKGSWDRLMAKRKGDTRQLSSISIGELWLFGAPRELFDHAAQLYSARTRTSLYKADAQPFTKLMLGVTDVIGACLNTTRPGVIGDYSTAAAAIRGARELLLDKMHRDAVRRINNTF